MSGDRPPAGLPTHLRLLAPLGAGASSTVWRARDTRRGRDVALKLLEPTNAEPTNDAGPTGTAERARTDSAQQLEREVRSLARLAGVPGVLELYECGTTADGVTWLVTELLSSGSLEDRARTSPLGIEEAVTVAAALADTLAAAHGLGVVHGDLTPSNVLFGPKGEPMLADFGLANLDGRGTGGCTPAYAAPERLRGAPASPAGDVWSLAATVLTTSIGRDGWGSERVPAPLRDCLSERPSARPDAAELARQLRGRPPRTRTWTPTRLARLRDRGRRDRA